MKVELKISYKQLIDIIKQLPFEEVNKLKADIERIESDSDSATQDDWEELVVDGPIMSDKQYQAFEENRKSFNRWREK